MMNDAAAFDQAKEAMQLITETISMNNHLNNHAWPSAMIFLIALGYKNGGATLQQFHEELDKSKEYYSYLWKEEFNGK